MSEEEVIVIVNPPPTKPKVFNWSGFTKKLSTLVAAVAVALTGVSASVLAYYQTLPPEQQAGWPFWLPMALVIGPGVVAALGPVAVAFRQAWFADDGADQAGA